MMFCEDFKKVNVMRLFIWLILLVFSGCSFEPLGGVLCDSEGQRDGARICKDGVWTPVDSTTPIEDAGDDFSLDQDVPDLGIDQGDSGEGDMPESDMADLPDMVAPNDMSDMEDMTDMGDMPDSCVPFSQQTLCQSQGLNCGDTQLVNNCGETVAVNCGNCAAPLQCGAGGTPNVCACVGASDTELCQEAAAECGTITVLDDTCGQTRQVNCGVCSGLETCGGGGTPNSCGCIEEPAAFCQRLGKNCGNVTDFDACGIIRTYDCGDCLGQESCGVETPNVCACDAEIICEASGAQCGTVSATGCSNFNTVNCGSCTGGTCNNQQCLCPSGFEASGGECQDIDECTLGTNTCDANAICTNTTGSFECACAPGFAGDGINCERVFPTVIGTWDGVSNDEQVTVENVGSNTSGDAYFVVISLDTLTRTVDTVDGLGLTWTRIIEQCNGTSNERLEVWSGRGNTMGGDVDIELSGDPFGVAASVVQVANVATLAGQGSSSSANGGCAFGVPGNSYSWTYTPQSASSLLLAATTTRGGDHGPGTGWTEIQEVGTQNTKHGIMTQENISTSDVTVSGTLSQWRNWASMVLELQGP